MLSPADGNRLADLPSTLSAVLDFPLLFLFAKNMKTINYPEAPPIAFLRPTSTHFIFLFILILISLTFSLPPVDSRPLSALRAEALSQLREDEAARCVDNNAKRHLSKPEDVTICKLRTATKLIKKAIYINNRTLCQANQLAATRDCALSRIPFPNQ